MANACSPDKEQTNPVKDKQKVIVVHSHFPSSGTVQLRGQQTQLGSVTVTVKQETEENLPLDCDSKIKTA